MAKPPAPGDPADRATISLGFDTVRVCQSYEVKSAVLEQPNAFALRLGSDDLAKTLIQKYPSRTPFSLFIGGQKQFVGTTDGPEADETSGGTEVTIKGRDDIKFLTDSDVSVELTFKNVTYPSIVQAVLGQPDVGLGSRLLLSSNDANRKIRSGAHVLVRVEPQTLDQILANPDAGGAVVEYVTAKVGESWWQLLQSKLKTAGLFLWTDNAGNFVLSQPSAQQNAIYRIERWRGKNPNLVNAEHSRFRNDTSRRHSEVVVYSRIGRAMLSRGTVKGRYTDDEMVALGYKNIRVLHDKWVTSEDQGEFLARRTLAEERRDGWELTYEVAGHTTQAIDGSIAVWTPDTIVEVRDDEYGLDGQYYLESCDYRGAAGAGGTTTSLHLMRIGDLIFGADE